MQVSYFLQVHECVASQTMFDPPFAYQDVTSLAKNMHLTEHKVEDTTLCSIEHTNFPY